MRFFGRKETGFGSAVGASVAIPIAITLLLAGPARADLSGGGVCVTVTGTNPDAGCNVGVAGKPCTFSPGVAGVCRNVPVPLSSLVGCVCVPAGKQTEETKGTGTHGSAVTPSCGQTLTFSIDTGQPQSIWVTLPYDHGGGMKELTSFSGSFTVTGSTIIGQPNQCNLQIVSGTFTAPSLTLADGTPTGANAFAFGSPSLSAGVLDLVTGQYTASAVGTITNTMFPGGVAAQGYYKGQIDFAQGTVTIDSSTVDVVPSPVPSLSEYGIAILVAGLLLAGLWLMRRRLRRPLQPV